MTVKSPNVALTAGTPVKIATGPASGAIVADIGFKMGGVDLSQAEDGEGFGLTIEANERAVFTLGTGEALWVYPTGTGTMETYVGAAT